VPETRVNSTCSCDRITFHNKTLAVQGLGLDVIGEIRPTSSKCHRFILVGIDYFTKWIEVVPLPKVDQQAVISFIQNHILYRFGIPETITIGQGSTFVGRKMVEFIAKAFFSKSELRLIRLCKVE